MNDFIDVDLVFNSASHTYTHLSHPGLQFTSVTALIESYSRPFDSRANSARIAARDGRSQSTILREWADNSSRACAFGTAIHNFADEAVSDYFTRGVTPSDRLAASDGRLAASDDGYKTAALKFIASLNPYGSAMTELRICSPDDGVAGSVDLLVENCGSLQIYDYKTSARIDTGFSTKNLYSPLHHLRDCSYMKYALQLHVYRELIKRRWGVEAEVGGVVWLGRGGTMELVSIPDFSEEAVMIIDRGPKKDKRVRY